LFIYMLNYEFLDSLFVLEEQNGRKLKGWISDYTHSWILFDFLWIIGCAKNSKIFTILVWKLWIFDWNCPVIWCENSDDV